MSKIITSNSLNMLEDVEPTEILAAIHKRIVSAEKSFIEVRSIMNEFGVELEMLKDRMSKLESSRGNDE